MFIILLTIPINPSWPQLITCPAGGHPNNLAQVMIWTKKTNQGTKIYRIGGKELKREYSSNPSLDEIFLNSGPLMACPRQCTFKLSTNLRSTDGMVLHQENAEGVPHGYIEINEPKDFYCARSMKDCGATVPIYQYKNETQLNSKYAYSFDANEIIEGYIRGPNPICYGWKDNTKITRESPSNSTECTTVAPVRNGKIIYEPATTWGTFPMGSSATLLCDEGFKPTKNNKIICITGSWYPMKMFDDCIPISVTAATEGCGPLPPHENGHILYSHHGSNEFPTGTLAYLICNGHYRSVNTRQARCARGQWSTLKLGTCQLMTSASCMVLPDVRNGEIKYIMGSRTNITIGTVAELVCSSGYAVNGVDAVICEPPGWSPASTLGTCEKDIKGYLQREKRQGTKPCIGGFPPMLNGQIFYSNEANSFGSYPSNTVAVVRCNIGYTINGAFLSTCEDSLWQPPKLGTCIATPGIVPVRPGNPCPFGLTTPIGGTITYSRGGALGPYPSGTTGTLDCAYGLPQGPTLAVCDNGIWIPTEMGLCTSPHFGNSINSGAGGDLDSCLSDYPLLGNGVVVYSSGAFRPPYPSMTTANVRCNLGYVPTGTVVALCRNGQWSPSKPTQCVRADGKANGNSFYGKQFGTLLGAPLPVGSFIEPGANLLGLSCGAGVATPVNGYVTYSTGSLVGPFPSGTIATATCNLGFTPAGVTSATCMNGVWSPSILGECVALGSGVIGSPYGSVGTGTFGAPCAPLAAPINGQISYSNGLELGPFPAGTTATVVCNQNYVPVGIASATCINGVFSPLILPQCVPGGNGAGFGELPCIPLAEPINGELTYSEAATTTYASRTIANLVCNLGFIASGPVESTCINGQWQPPTLGICQQSIFGLGVGLRSASTQCLFELPAVVNGKIRYSTGSIVPPYDSGTSATLTCNIGSTPIGATLSTCVNGVWNPPALGQCPMNDVRRTRQLFDYVRNFPPIDCPVSPPVTNGKIYYYSNATRYNAYAPGTIATLICDNGYVVTGRTWSQCRGGIWSPWPGVGSCQPRSQQRQYPEKVTRAPGSCSTVFTITNGKVIYEDNGTDGVHKNSTRAELECNHGYTIDGNKITYCLNGFWIPILGNCRSEVDTSVDNLVCKPLKPPLNGKVYYIYSGYLKDHLLGTTAVLSCNKGYNVTGRTTLTCSDTGWVPHDGFGICTHTNYGFSKHL